MSKSNPFKWNWMVITSWRATHETDTIGGGMHFPYRTRREVSKQVAFLMRSMMGRYGGTIEVFTYDDATKLGRNPWAGKLKGG